jgi:YHS domain-containing protein
LTYIENGAGGSPNVIGLRVYFAAFDPTEIPDQPSIDDIKHKQVLQIYAPTDVDGKDIGQYYYFGSDKKPHRFKKNSNDAKPGWINYFEMIEAQTALVSTLNPSANRREYNNGVTTDTKSILYCYADFIDYLRTERLYQDSIRNLIKKPVIDTIEVDFASFLASGWRGSPHPGWFKNRLHVLFEFKSEGATVTIQDNLDDFNNRYKNAGVAAPKCDILKNKGGDNGQLCPPYNCPK